MPEKVTLDNDVEYLEYSIPELEEARLQAEIADRVKRGFFTSTSSEKTSPAGFSKLSRKNLKLCN